MKKTKNLLLSILLMTIIGMFSACSPEKDNYLSSIPAESAMVFKLNTAQLLTKSNLLNNPLITGVLMQADQAVPEALKAKYEEIKKNPEASGIDFQKPLAIAVELFNLYTTSATAFDKVSVDAVIAISDAKKFDELMKSLSESESSITITEADGFKQVNFPDKTISMAYNDTRAVMVYGQERTAASLVNLKAEASMLAQPDFAEFASNDKDCSIFMDYTWAMNAVVETQKSMNVPVPYSPQLMEYIKDMSAYGSLNFETGKVVGNMKVYLSGDAKKYMEEFYIKPNGKLIGLLPADTYLGFNFAIKNYSQCLKYIGEEVRQQIEKQLKQYGLSEEIIDNVHGDILIGIYQDADNAMIPGIVVAAQCKDRTLFNKVKELMNVSTEGDMFEIPNIGHCVTYVDNTLVISPKKLYDQCLASGSIKAWANSWKGTSMGKTLEKGGMAIDFQAICKNKFLSEMANNRQGAMTLSVLKQLESFTIQMNNMQETSSELNLTDKNKNALEQLITIGINAAMTR